MSKDLTEVAVQIAITPEGMPILVRDGKTAGQMLMDAKSAAGKAASRSDGIVDLGVVAAEARPNVADAIQRAAKGDVRLPGHDGKPYLNSDGVLPPRHFNPPVRIGP